MVSFDHVRYMFDKTQYKQKNLAIAVLLEGKFISNYKNNMSSEEKEKFNFIEQSKEENNMIIISDGDLIRNQIGKSRESKNLEISQNGKLFATPLITKPLPLGYDKNTYEKHNNSNFILNCINYLIEKNAVNKRKTRQDMDGTGMKDDTPGKKDDGSSKRDIHKNKSKETHGKKASV